jgi:hypothetical protein
MKSHSKFPRKTVSRIVNNDKTAVFEVVCAGHGIWCFCPQLANLNRIYNDRKTNKLPFPFRTTFL